MLSFQTFSGESLIRQTKMTDGRDASIVSRIDLMLVHGRTGKGVGGSNEVRRLREKIDDDDEDYDEGRFLGGAGEIFPVDFD